MLSKSDFALTIELINRCLQLKSKEDIGGFYRILSSKLDIDCLMVGHTTSDLVSAQSYYFDLNDWKTLYENKNFIAIDPVIPFAFKSENSVNWSDAYNNAEPQSNEFIRRAKDYNLLNGISFGTLKHSITSSSNIVSVGSGGKPFDDLQSIILQQILPHISEVLGRQSIWQRPHLTVRELEVIKWCTAGKSYWETSQIMGIAERTVKFHMKNICQKFDVVNKSHAIARGVSLGLTYL